MDIYTYIAANDPYGAHSLLDRYGYTFDGPDSPEYMGYYLKELVAQVGEPAMIDLLLLHPDRDAIIESASQKKSGCGGCGGCGGKKKDAYVPLPGNAQIKESHLFIFAGALVIAAAIISKS